MTKSQLRRHGLQTVVNDPIEHRNVLAVHYVSKKPGLESVVKALARFRQLAMKSCRQPTLVFKEAPWDGWKRKKQLTHSAGTFWWYAKTLRIPNEKQHHVKIHVETQYIIPFSNDLRCPPRNSNGEKTHTKKTCCDGQKTTSTSTGQKKMIRHCNTSCMKWTALKIPSLPQWNTDFSQSQWSRLTSYRRTYSPWRNVYILTIPF